jgi:hypothetical protein
LDPNPHQTDKDPQQWQKILVPERWVQVEGEVPENSVDSEVAEEVLVLAEDLAAEGGAGDVHQILPASRTVPFRQCVFK